MPRLRGRGPGLRGPQISMPQPVADLYADLRDRRLLPVVAALLVAMIAVPFVFGKSSDGGGEPAAAGESPAAVAAGPTRLIVSEAPDPGLRDYRKRLAGKEKNPFKQQYTTVPPSADVKSTGSGSSDVDVSVSETGSSTDVNVDVSSSGDSGGSSDDETGIRFFGFRPDVRFGKAGSGKLAKHNELPIGTVLPKKQGVVLFLGVSENGKRALFLVSPRIIVVKGSGSCTGGKKNCEILSLKKGQAVSLVGAEPLPVYRLSVVDIELVEIEEANQAKAGSSGVRSALGSVRRVQRFSK